MSTKRRPGRPPAGVDGTSVRSYPQVRIARGDLEKLRQLAQDRGEALHEVLGRLIERGL